MLVPPERRVWPWPPPSWQPRVEPEATDPARQRRALSRYDWRVIGRQYAQLMSRLGNHATTREAHHAAR